MCPEPLTLDKPHGRGRRMVLFGLLILLVTGAAGGRAYLKRQANMAGLEGTWGRDRNDSLHTYQFRVNGDVDCYLRGLGMWGRMGPFETWDRDGQMIIIRSRYWDFVGQLYDKEIRGRVTVRDGGNTFDEVWRRE